jgi:UDP-N-acetylglucosamine 2-epimerase (non-hydrolysing)
MSLLIAYGTRPEWLKIKPIISELEKRNLPFKTLFTGQHDTLIDDVSENKIPDFEISIPDYTKVDRLSLVISSITYNCKSIFESGIDYVIVQGDTVSAYAVALAAFNNGVKVIHLEAGLRTHDSKNPYPEESYRQMISRITDIHFCPTSDNEYNLIKEMVAGKKYVVGNTLIDTLVPYVNEIESQDKVIITLHRRENHAIMHEWFEEINVLAEIHRKYEFILPLHPNPNVQKHKEILKNVTITKPFPHHEFLKLLAKSKIVISDSGGIQEECSFFNKRVIVCRKTTERPESLGTTSILCPTPRELFQCFLDADDPFNRIKNTVCPYGDGTSSKKIVDILQEEIFKAK